MATSSLYREFKVSPQKAQEFVCVMSRSTTSTLRKEFVSHLVLQLEGDLKQKMQTALSE